MEFMEKLADKLVNKFKLEIMPDSKNFFTDLFVNFRPSSSQRSPQPMSAPVPSPARNNDVEDEHPILEKGHIHISLNRSPHQDIQEEASTYSSSFSLQPDKEILFYEIELLKGKTRQEEENTDDMMEDEEEEIRQEKKIENERAGNGTTPQPVQPPGEH